MPVRARTALAAPLLAALAGCASCDSVPGNAVTDCNTEIVPGGAATDILFVVDDSGSMSEEQDELSANLGVFIDELLGSAIALDLRVGVTNGSVEDYVVTAGTATGYGRGAGSGFPGVPGTPYPQGTLVAIEQDPNGIGTAGHFLWGRQYDPAGLASTFGGPRILASGGGQEAARDFKANVKQGTWGSSREQMLSAMRRALQKASCPGPNCGFLRAGARLAVVILTDEDDCSGQRNATISGDLACHNSANYGRLDPLADFVDYLDTTVGGQPIVALIAGFDASGATSLCTGDGFGTTTRAFALPTRLDAFLDLLDPAHERTVKASICQQFAATLAQIADIILPQTLPLKQAPADYRMFAVSVRKPSGQVVPCPTGTGPGAVADPSIGAVYNPPPPGGSASVTFQNACRLGAGDRIDIKIVCAR